MEIVILNSGPDRQVFRTIGAYKISHVCRQFGYSVKVIDHVIHFSKNELITILEKFINEKTFILGISTTFISESGQLPATINECIIYIKNLFPNLKIIWGGYFTNIANSSNIDTYCTIPQYGEDIFIDVANHIIRGLEDPTYRLEFNKQGKKFKVYTQPLIERYNIETDQFRFHPDDNIIYGETLPIEISRGCIFKCKFCNHRLLGRGKFDYLKNFDYIKEELIHNHVNFGTKSYYIICDTFNDTEYKIKQWYDMLKSLPFKIRYTSYLRADLLDKFKDVPYMLQDSGLISCFHGIETFNKKSALAIGKGWSASRAKDFIPKLYHEIWNKKIPQTLSFIMGLPGDTRENILEICDWFIDNQLHKISLHPLGLTNDPSTKNLSEFERNYKKYNYKFLKPDAIFPTYGNWVNDYWSYKEVLDFRHNVILPKIKPYNNKFSNWDLVQVLGLGVDEGSIIEKHSQINTFEFVKKKYLYNYKKALLS